MMLGQNQDRLLQPGTRPAGGPLTGQHLMPACSARRTTPCTSMSPKTKRSCVMAICLTLRLKPQVPLSDRLHTPQALLAQHPASTTVPSSPTTLMHAQAT